MSPRPCALLAAALLASACGELEPIRDCADQGDVRVLCGFQNPEDLAVAPGGAWIVVSQFPRMQDGAMLGAGSLLALRPSDGERRELHPTPEAATEAAAGVGSPRCSGPPDPTLFAPHGIDVAPVSEREALLLVINHGGREAVEWFRLVVDAAGPRAIWQGCVPLPDDAQGNDVAALPDGALVVSNMLPRDAGILGMLRLALGRPTGELLEWDAAGGWRAVPGTRASAPNGVEASPDGETLFFAAWGSSQLVRIGRDGSGRRELALPHHPDNLTWDGEGRLLVAGQMGSITRIPACTRIEGGTCPLPHSVLRVAPDALTLEPVFAEDPARLGGASSVALAHQGALWIGTFAGDRILRVPETR